MAFLAPLLGAGGAAGAAGATGVAGFGPTAAGSATGLGSLGPAAGASNPLSSLMQGLGGGNDEPVTKKPPATPAASGFNQNFDPRMSPGFTFGGY